MAHPVERSLGELLFLRAKLIATLSTKERAEMESTPLNEALLVGLRLLLPYMDV